MTSEEEDRNASELGWMGMDLNGWTTSTYSCEST